MKIVVKPITALGKALLSLCAFVVLSFAVGVIIGAFCGGFSLAFVLLTGL